MIKAVIFDYGGVIANDPDEILIQNIARRFGMTFKETSEIIEEIVKPYQKGLISGTEFWKQFSKKANKNLPEGWKSLWNYNLEKKIDCKMINLVKKLKKSKYITALLSNTIYPHAKFNKIQGGYDIFSPIVLSFEVGSIKPEEEIFKIMLKKLKLLPEECVYIDDKKEYAKAASKIGMHGIKFNSYKKLIEDLKQLCVNV